MFDDLMELQTPGGVQQIISPDQWLERRTQILTAFHSIIGDPPLAVPPPLEPQVNDEYDEGAYLRYHVSYSVDSEDRVPAWMLVPKGLTQRAPAVLCLHETTDFGKDEPVGLAGKPHVAHARALALRRYVVLVPDHLAANERCPPGQQDYDTNSFYARHPNWSAVGKAIWDGQRALDYLCTRPEVDAQRMGVMGHSLGGHGAVFVAGADARVNCAVCSCGITVLARDSMRLDWARDEWYIYMPRLRPIFLGGLPAPFDFHHLVALIAPRPFLNLTALNDDENFAATDAIADLGLCVTRVYRLLGAEDRFANYLHGSGHALPEEARALAYAWLDRWLRPDATPFTSLEEVGS